MWEQTLKASCGLSREEGYLDISVKPRYISNRVPEGFYSDKDVNNYIIKLRLLNCVVSKRVLF